MQKRGKKGAINEQLLFLIIDITIILVVWLALFNYVRSVERDTLFDKIYLTKDIALLINTAYSSPGNLFYTYSSDELDLSLFDFYFKDGFVTIKENPDGNELYFPYAADSSFETELPNIVSPEKIEFAKTDNKLQAKESLTYDLNQLSCPNIGIEGKLSSQSIVVDPGHGAVSGEPKDPGLEFKDYNLRDKKEAYITADIANHIEGALDNVELTRYSDSYETTEARLTVIEEHNAGIVISIHIGNYSNNHNSVKAFIKHNPGNPETYLKSRKLACMILNEFSSKLELDGIVIVPIDTSTLAEEDPMQIINFEDKIAVLFEIGNINTVQGRKMFNDISKTSNSIKQGLTNYYSK